MDDFKISSNWFSETADLKNVITFIRSDQDTCDIDHITPDTCVCLTKKENDCLDSKPELDIKLKHTIKEINIFSEGSLIEVFGVHDEYLFTCLPRLIDDWEGLAVYHAKICLPGLSSCKLKFTRIKEKGRLWLYSVQLSITKTEDQYINNTLFNFENVNKLINSSAHQISGKAEKFKKFFELYAKNSSNSQAFSLQNLLNIVHTERNVQLSDCRKAVADHFSNSKVLSSCESSTVKKDENEINGNELSLECQYLKVYIDKKFMELREDMMKHMEIKLNTLREENNTKLDEIIRLLESSNV